MYACGESDPRPSPSMALRGSGLPAVVAVALLALAAGVAATLAGVRQAPRPERSITDRPVQVEEEGVVSSRTCQLVSSVAVHELASLLPPHDDAGGHA